MNRAQINQIQIADRFGTLDLQAGASFSNQFIVVSGENGAGKTSLLRCIAGLESAEGQIMMCGKVWLDSSAGFTLQAEQRHVGCVWVEAALLPWLSVEKNITLGSKHLDPARLSHLTDQLEISALLQRKPSMLSTGEAQRVALARAMYRKPAALLLDEPFSAQAPAIRSRLRKALKSIQIELQIPVIMVSHDAEDANVLAHQHWHMREGKLLTPISRHSRDQVNGQAREYATGEDVNPELKSKVVNDE